MNSRIFATEDSIQTGNYVWIDKNILVVEDIDLNYLYMAELLKPTGTNISRACNGKEAVDCCQNDLNIDMVLMDIYMPIMNGYEATKQIKTLRPELPIIAQTAYTRDEDRQRATEAGCDDFIPKPIDKEELLSKIDHFFQKKN